MSCRTSEALAFLFENIKNERKVFLLACFQLVSCDF